LRRERRVDEAPRGRTGRKRPVARRYARVVHDLASPTGQLREGSVRDERAAAAGPAPPPRGAARMRPGPFLRLTAIGGAVGTLVAVVSGTAGLGAGPQVLAALALPPLAAVVVVAWTSYRQLLAPSLTALVLFGLAAAVTAPGVHLALAAL